jgi:hypothetical protein
MTNPDDAILWFVLPEKFIATRRLGEALSVVRDGCGGGGEQEID